MSAGSEEERGLLMNAHQSFEEGDTFSPGAIDSTGRLERPAAEATARGGGA
jgi:hypothetical protein